MAKKSPALPSIQILFHDSWSAFKGSVLNLLILDLVSFGIWLGLIIIGVLISLPFLIFPIQAAIKSNSFNPAAFGGAGVVLLLLIVTLTIVGLAIHAATILFVGKYTSKPEFGKTFKSGFKFILPLFLVSILSGFIIMGGYFLFIIPGIFFAILFCFAPYEVVLNGQGVLSSLKRSSRIVLSNFWAIFARFVLWIIIVMVVSFLPGILSGRNAAAGASLSGLSFFVNIFMGWFGICYFLTLYKQASRGFETDKGTRLLWPVVTAVVGWIVGIVMLVTLSSVILFAVSSMMQKSAKPKTYPMYQVQQAPSYNNWQPSTPSAR